MDKGGGRHEGHIPTVVPAECIVYSNPLFLSRRCTSATSLETDAVGVPRGMRQKSAMQDGGVWSIVGSFDAIVVDRMELDMVGLVMRVVMDELIGWLVRWRDDDDVMALGDVWDVEHSVQLVNCIVYLIETLSTYNTSSKLSRAIFCSTCSSTSKQAQPKSPVPTAESEPEAAQNRCYPCHVARQSWRK
jgi:hypothetical protein